MLNRQGNATGKPSSGFMRPNIEAQEGEGSAGASKLFGRKAETNLGGKAVGRRGRRDGGRGGRREGERNRTRQTFQEKQMK